MKIDSKDKRTLVAYGANLASNLGLGIGSGTGAIIGGIERIAAKFGYDSNDTAVGRITKTALSAMYGLSALGYISGHDSAREIAQGVLSGLMALELGTQAYNGYQKKPASIKKDISSMFSSATGILR
jgi:hypothetical protein